MKSTIKPSKTTKKSGKEFKGFADGEREAMKARILELNTPSKGKADGESAVLAKIAIMPTPYRGIAERIHALIMKSAPELLPKTWYGLPAYAKDGKIVCYMRMNPKNPYNDRYLTFGFNEAANLDEDTMWPVAFALEKLTAAEEEKIRTLVKKAIRNDKE